MPVVAVINRKGGSGKSTLATHLAGWCATSGMRVMLGDVDRQQSSLGWLKRRAAQPGAAEIAGWAADGRSVMRPPSGVTHVVLDTPGGLREAELARVVMYADAILMPVCGGAFDRESASACHAELITLPRVASGRCKVGVVGMRLDARTRAAEATQAWAREAGIDHAGTLREAQVYVRCAEQGLTLFDLPATKVEADRAQWQPVLEWLLAAWASADRMDRAAKPGAKPLAAVPARPVVREPVLRPPTVPGRAAAQPAGPLGRLLSVFR